MSTPLTDAINALTTYANSVTGESDTTLTDAVYTLAEGYGQGGGESNTVTGTFTGTAEGSIDIDLAYAGEGYPIGVMIFPSASSEATFKSTIHQYSCAFFACVKDYLDYTPSYTGTRAYDFTKTLYRYKTSTTDASRTGDSNAITGVTFADADATSDSNKFVRVRSSTKLAVYIRGTSGWAGFMPNIEYTYIVVYSDVNTSGGGSGDSGLTLTWYDGEVM